MANDVKATETIEEVLSIFDTELNPLLSVDGRKEIGGKTIKKSVWDDTTRMAKQLMCDYENGRRGENFATIEQYKHWQKIASGFVPFGCKVEK